MPSRAISRSSISFGLVSIPVEVFPATSSKSIHFNLLHAKDNSRIAEKIYCLADDKIIDRSELVHGFPIQKSKYVSFTNEELKKLESGAAHEIEIEQFIPISEVDGSVRASELKLAERLINDLSMDKFHADKFKDTYREKILEAAKRKAAGEEVTAPRTPKPAKVIDLMSALKNSLKSKRGKSSEDKNDIAAGKPGSLKRSLPHFAQSSGRQQKYRGARR